MSLRSFPWRAAIALLVLSVPVSLEAKHFKRYPDDVEDAEKEEKAPGDRQPDKARAPAGKDTSSPDGTKEGVNREGQNEDKSEAEDEKDKGEKDDFPPGLFGYALHGGDGLKLEYIYTGEVFTNMRGGISTKDATRYLGLMDIAVTADLKKLGFQPGGTFFLLGEDSHGMGLTERFVGDRQWLSNIDPGYPFTQVTEYWWQRKIWDDRVTVRLGKQDANAEFAVVDLGGDFVNSSFGVHHNIPMATWPNTAMGVTTLVQLTEPLAFKCGVYDGAADIGSWGISEKGTVFSLYEFETEWNLDGKRLPGDFHFGLWYHSGTWSNVVHEDMIHSGDHGAYMGMDQMLWKESHDPENPQGLGIFFQYGWCPESINDVPHYFGTGLVYKGLIPGRDDDVTGLGAAQAIFSSYLDRPAETAVELFYKMPLTRYITLEPDLQYIANPDGRYRDAFVFGLRFEAVL